MTINPNSIIHHGDCLEKLKELESDSIDCIVTDPPYGYSFMNKDWDKAVVSVDVWKECLRVLKAGAFAFIMSSPRQDVLCRMILNLIDAGFETNFTSIYWTYASGFPKAANVSKLVDKRNGRTSEEHKQLGLYLKQKRIESKIPSKELSKLFPSKTGGLTGCLWNWENGENVPTKQQYNILKDKLDLDDRFDELIEREEAEREIIGKSKTGYSEILGHKIEGKGNGLGNEVLKHDITIPKTEQAKRLDGSYAGFQPKPALETILVVMKPLSEKSFVDQALKNGKGITWLDDCRIPFRDENDANKSGWQHYDKNEGVYAMKKFAIEQGDRKNFGNCASLHKSNPNEKGRFPANLLVSDDSLNDGKITKSHVNSFEDKRQGNGIFAGGLHKNNNSYNDSGSHSRYFDLDSWSNAQFIICPKASPSERNKGLENEEKKFMATIGDGIGERPHNPNQKSAWKQNHHPTVKPIKLMSYLITMGSRPNDIILDPFCGSGTTGIAALQLGRKFIGIEKELEYVEIAQKRIEPYLKQEKILNYLQSSSSNNNNNNKMTITDEL